MEENENKAASMYECLEYSIKPYMGLAFTFFEMNPQDKIS